MNCIDDLDWEERAWDLGFKGNDREMLLALYPVTPMGELEKMLKMSYRTILKRLEKFGIPKRPSGRNAVHISEKRKQF